MRQEVPQFIDVEDKLFGPLTFRQFLYLVGGGGLGYLAYKIIPFPFSFLAIIPIVALALALAFYRINGRPFIEILQAWIAFQFKRKLYIWKHEITSEQKPARRAEFSALSDLSTTPVDEPLTPPRQNIAELSKNLDILDPH